MATTVSNTPPPGLQGQAYIDWLRRQQASPSVGPAAPVQTGATSWNYPAPPSSPGPPGPMPAPTQTSRTSWSYPTPPLTPLQTQQASTGIEAGSQKDLMGAQSALDIAAADKARTFEGQQAQLDRATQQALQNAQISEAQRSQGAGFGQESSLLSQKAALQAEAEKRRLDAYKGLLGSTGGIGGGTTDPNLAFDEQAARDAAFARAKDQAGQVGRSALDSLRSALGAQGRLGGAYEAQRTGEVIGGAAGNLGEYTREQLMADLNRAAGISDRNVAAGLTRRGQDLNLQQTLLGLINAPAGLY